MTTNRTELRRDLAAVLNKHSVENESNTPDFILADYLVECLDTFATAVRGRANWGVLDGPEITGSFTAHVKFDPPYGVDIKHRG